MNNQAHAAAQALDHRADIQGLRGIAVLAVTAVHAWPDLLRGGFIGVDMFFVLSGYLISSIIFSQAEAGQFSLQTFYARRVKRLFPALLFMLVVTLAAAVLLTFPSQAQQIGRHVAAGSVFASNIALWTEAGYFDASSDTKPLLHLWSLGIEEQFYIVWPLLALAVVRARGRGGWLLLIVLAASFVLNVWWVEDKAKGTFFLLPTRAWELLLGAGWAWLSQSAAAPAWGRQLQTASLPVRQGLAALGVALLVAAFALLDKNSHFPGWWALLPTLGTVALLAAGPSAWFNRCVLSHPLLVFYGGISYPLYLWHWPLLVFPVQAGVELDNATRVLMLAASVGLAALTVELIEQPVREGRFGRWATPALLASMMVVGLGGWQLHASDGWMSRLPRELQPIARADFAADFSTYRAGRCFLDLEQDPTAFDPGCAPTPGPASALLWGDSHAAALYTGLKDSWPQLAQWTKARCPPLLKAPAGASRGCAQTLAYVWQSIRERPPHTVVMGGFWSFYGTPGGAATATAEVREVVRALRALGVQRVVVVGHLPTWTTPLPRLLLTQWRDGGDVPDRLIKPLDSRALAADQAMNSALRGTDAIFISPYEALCNAQGCLTLQAHAGLLMPIALDESHLTPSGSALFVSLSQGRFVH